jgi:hypothetical protein
VLRRNLGAVRCAAARRSPRFFDGLELIQPGVVFLPFWRPDSLTSEAGPGGTLMLCGVARKP